MVRISRNSEQFVRLLQHHVNETRPTTSAGVEANHRWNGHVQENSHLLENLYDPSDFVLAWLDSGNEGRKKEVLEKIHLNRACVVHRNTNLPKLNGDCAWCSLLPGNVTLKSEQIDHIIPFSFFPQFDGKDWNYQGLCKNHNSQKGSFPVPIQNQRTSEDMLALIWTDLT